MVCSLIPISYQLPNRVLFCDSIDYGAKLLFAFLNDYLIENTNEPTNKELQEIFLVSRRTIQRWIKQLAEQKFIHTHVEISKEFAQVTRYIKIARDV